jgi:hypothetical protein
MPNRSNYPPFIVLAGIIVAIALSCTQPTDVVSPITSTTLSLVAERLPTTPDGMIYEVWAASSNDTVSLGKFLYNVDSLKFYDSTGTERPNKFTLHDDLLKKAAGGYVWNSVFVSVETYPGSNTTPGPIMLVDQVTNPDDDPITMVFPLSDSLWQAGLFYNFEGVSDRNPYAGIGQGLWFSRFKHDYKLLNDTLSVSIDSSGPLMPAADTSKYYPCHVRSIRVETTLVTFPPDTLVFGYDYSANVDTIKKIAVRIDWDTCKLNPPTMRASLVTTYDTVPHVLDVSVFDQYYQGLPDYTSYGWKYRGWVVSTTVPKTAIGSFTPPAWKYKGPTWNFIPGDTGGLLTTGTFTSLERRSESGNPYGYPKPANSMYDVTPQSPGADFLNGSAMAGPLHGLSYVQLVPFTSHEGTVFVSLEPINFVGRNTNFPLIFAMRDIANNPYVYTQDIVEEDMYNKTSHVKGDLQGFPAVYVTIERF